MSQRVEEVLEKIKKEGLKRYVAMRLEATEARIVDVLSKEEEA